MRSGVGSDLAVQWRVLVGIGVFTAGIGTLYWFVSYEDAGTVMLALAAGLAFLAGGWLFLRDRRSHAEPAPVPHVPRTGAHPEIDEYLPRSSIWPLVIGVGAAVTLNGLILGFAYCVPGLVVVAGGVCGFVAEGRRRA